MTTTPRLLTTPAIDAQTFAVRRTARSSHAFVLADLVNDAAAGHCAQRWALERTSTGDFHWFYDASSTARLLVLRARVGIDGGAYTVGDAIRLGLSVTDGATTITTAPTIPDGLVGTRDLFPVLDATEFHRLASLGASTWVIDVDALRASLTASDRWRFHLAVTCDTSALCEVFQVEELPRFMVDTADDYGQLPQDYQPRAVILDGSRGLSRLGVTLLAALTRSLRTYHAMARDVAAPWSTTSTSYGGLQQDLEGSAAIRYRVRPRNLRGGIDVPVAICLRYRTVGMSNPAHKARVRLHTGASASPFVFELADTAGTWTDVKTGQGQLAVGGDGTDTLWWTAKTDSGTLELCSRVVIDEPT